MDFLFHPLNLVTFFPLVGVLVLLFLGKKEQENLVRWVALGTALLTFGISLWVLSKFNPDIPFVQMYFAEPWIEFAGWTIHYAMGIDGISISAGAVDRFPDTHCHLCPPGRQ